MPRRPAPQSFMATSLGSLLRDDANLDPKLKQQLEEQREQREKFVHEEAAGAAERYLDVRAQSLGARKPAQIWARANLDHQGIVLPQAAPPIPSHVRAAFDAFDVDRSGFIEHRELRNALRFLGFDVNDALASSILAAYDTRILDGRLELAEFARLVLDAELGGVYMEPYGSRAADIVPPRVKAAFKFFDADGDGKIDAAELRNILRHYGIDLTTRYAL
jgi:hypothetical protein